MTSGPPAGPDDQSPALPACVRHPNRPTGLRCSRCDRPACPECLRPAAVGQHCVDCLAAGQRTVRRPVTIAGASAATRRPVVVPILIALNVLVFVVTVIQARSLTSNTASTLAQQWALWPLAARNGGWWQFVTAGFIHNGSIHILFNMVALWVLGRDFERILGPARFTAVYLVSLFGGNVAVFLFGSVASAVAGASGAIFGLMGGLLVVVVRLKLNPGAVIGMIVVNLVISVAIPGISLLGHVGGLATGAALTAAMIYAPAAMRLRWQVGAVALLLVVLLGLVFVREAQIPQTVCDFGTQVGCAQV